MGQQHGLRPLQVGVARKVDASGGLGSFEEHVLQGKDAVHDVAQLALAPQPQIGGHLVVAAPAGVQLGPRVARQLGDPALDRGMDVLVARDEREGRGGEFLVDRVERGQHRIALAVGEQAHAGEHAHVGATAYDVVDS